MAGVKMKKTLPSLFLIAIIVCGFALIGNLRFSLAQTGTNVTGILTSDTTWTQANSPYTLTGPVAVNTGVTLTIQAGPLVNLNGFYIQVNGTLTIQGSATNIVAFNGGVLRFTPVSAGWNNQTDTGCAIQYANLTSTSVSASNALKLDHDTIAGAAVTLGDASSVANSNVYSSITAGNFAIFTNDQIGGAITAGTNCTFTSNQVQGEISAGDGATVTGNNVQSPVICGGISSAISGNTIQGQVIGGAIFNNTILFGNVQGTVVSNNNVTWGTVNATVAATNNVIVSGNYTASFRVFGGYATPTENTPAIIAVGSPLISGNNVTGGGSYTSYPILGAPSTSSVPAIDLSSATAPTVSNNVITSMGAEAIEGNAYLISGNIVNGEVSASVSAVANNTIYGSLAVSTSNTTVQGNTVTGGISVGTPSWNITGNTAQGITVAEGSGTIADNSVSNGNGITVASASATIEDNLVSSNGGNSTVGFVNGTSISGSFGIAVENGTATILNNTITGNGVGIALYSPASATITYNNLENNSLNVFLEQGTAGNVDAVDNWWGTTDQQAINQSIHDFKNDFNLGTVTFIPFLTSPNPEASPSANAAVTIPSPINPPSASPTPSQSTGQTPLPSLPEFPSWIILPLVSIMTLVAAILVGRKKKDSLSATRKRRF